MKKLLLVVFLLGIFLLPSCDSNTPKYKITYAPSEGETEEWTLPTDKFSCGNGYVKLYTKKGEIYLFGNIRVQEIKKEDKEKEDE